MSSGPEYRFSNDVVGRIVRPDYPDGAEYPHAFGMELNGGDPLDGPVLNDLAFGSGRERLWSAVERFGFVRGSVARPLDFSDSPIWEPFKNARDRLNVVYHTDQRDFGLLSLGERAEDTAMCPRIYAVDVMMDKAEVLAEKSDRVAVELERFKAFVDLMKRTRFIYGDFEGDDLLKRGLSVFVFALSRDPSITDKDIFDFQNEVDKALGELVVNQSWQPGDVLFVSRWLLHRRVCREVEGVSRESNSLRRMERH